MDKTNHTLVLIQPGGEETRTYSDFDSIKEAMEGICYIFELYIKQSDSNLTTITYDVKQLFDFIDSLKEIVCLVFEETLSTYSAAQSKLDFSFFPIFTTPLKFNLMVAKT